MTAIKKQQKEELKSKYLNRELSWLKFNDRVLLEAQNIENPLYEINLNETFEIQIN